MKSDGTPAPKTSQGKAGEAPIERIFRKVFGREMTSEERQWLSLNGNGNHRTSRSRNGTNLVYKRAARRN